MALLYLTQSGSQDLDLTTDGSTDSADGSDGSFLTDFFSGFGKDLQLLRSPVDKVGQPLVSFQISNDNINWVDFYIIGDIFKDDSNFYEFEPFNKKSYFRITWLSNNSTGTFKAFFNTL